jgi:orotate phosphoribosyltransferase
VTERQKLLELLREKSVKTGDFTLASGKRSDFYVDVRQTSLHSEGSWLIARQLLEVIDETAVGIGGLTMGADPLACSTAAVSHSVGGNLHAFLIRKESKGHGTGQYVEGLANFEQGSPVVVVEDTTTTGGSLLTAIERAEAAGLNVIQCITVVDREEGAMERIQSAGYTLLALTTRTELLS